MSNEFSVESIYAIGTGFKKPMETPIKRNEYADVDSDSSFKELMSAESDMRFVETFGTLAENNSYEKMKMLKRIAITYRGKSRALESYLFEQSIEAESAAAAVGSTDAPKGNNVNTKAINDKKQSFFAKIFSNIAAFFKKIWMWIVERVSSIISKLKGLFDKNEADMNAGLTKEEVIVVEEKMNEDIVLLGIADRLTATEGDKSMPKINGRICENLKQMSEKFKIVCANMNGAFDTIQRSNFSNDSVFKDLQRTAESSSKFLSGFPGAGKIPPLNRGKNGYNEYKSIIDNISKSIDYKGYRKEYLELMFGPTIQITEKTKMKEIFQNMGHIEMVKTSKQILLDLNSISGGLKSTITKLTTSSDKFANMLEKRQFNASFEDNEYNKNTDENLKSNNEKMFDVFYVLQASFKLAVKISSECFMAPIKDVTELLVASGQTLRNKLKEILKSFGKNVKDGYVDGKKKRAEKGQTKENERKQKEMRDAREKDIENRQKERVDRLNKQEADQKRTENERKYGTGLNAVKNRAKEAANNLRGKGPRT